MVSRLGQRLPHLAPAGTKALVATASASPSSGTACRCQAHDHAHASTTSMSASRAGKTRHGRMAWRALECRRGTGHANSSVLHPRDARGCAPYGT